MRVKFIVPGQQCSNPTGYGDYCDANGCWKVGAVVDLPGRVDRLISIGIVEAVDNESTDHPGRHAVDESDGGDQSDSD